MVVLLSDSRYITLEPEQVVTQIHHLRGILVGLQPDLRQGLQLGLELVRRWRHDGSGQFATVDQAFQIVCKAEVGFRQLREGIIVSLHRQAGRLGQALREHPHFTGGGNVNAGIGRLPIVVIDDAGDDQHQQQQSDAKNLQLLGNRVLTQETGSAVRAFDRRLSVVHYRGR